MQRLTHYYNGKVAEPRNRSEAQAMAKKLAEYEDRDTKGCGYCTRSHIAEVDIKFVCNPSTGNPERLNPHRIPNYCPICGRSLWQKEEAEQTLKGE